MTDAPNTLLGPFQAPRGLAGHTVVLVTMTADTSVLDAIMTTFTGLSGRSRARQGQRTAYLLRDAGAWEGRSDVLSPFLVPGMHELRPRVLGGKWPRLVHSKLAVMTFSPNGRGRATHARLLVTTGNFTPASMKRQLELAFIAEADLLTNEETPGRADIQAAAEFVAVLAERHYELQAERSSGAASPLVKFDELIDTLSELNVGDRQPRFFHSLDQSLFQQLNQRAQLEVKPGRNLLLCGSGFVEQAVDQEAGPEVLEKLGSLSSLTRNPRRILMVPPETTGQLREWSSRSEQFGWERPIRATDRLDRSRKLHAKFVLLAKAEFDPVHVKSGHLYLGSGNLSRRGMIESGPQHQGNIECGVFFELGSGLSEEELEQLLFWNETAEPIEPDEWVTPEPLHPTGPPPIVPCPILHALVMGDETIALCWNPEAAASVLISPDASKWLKVEANAAGKLKFDDVPAVLHVATLDKSHTWQIPVVDELGRYAWMRDRLSSARALLEALEEMQGNEGSSVDEDVDDEDEDVGTSGRPRPTNPVERKYDLLDMAKFVETMARRQQALEPEQIDLWLEQLERIRDRPFEKQIFASWPTASIDLIEHLVSAPFAPPGIKGAQRSRYLEVLETMAARWGLR